MHPPLASPLRFTPRAMQVVRELGSRGEIETYTITHDVT